MINAKDNALINARLRNEYEQATDDFLREWSMAFQETSPFRINEFGIIDIHKFDTDNGILFIGRETNGWDDEDYKNGCLFRDWMRDITQNGLAGRGHIKQHPNMWYNIGRWAMLLTKPNLPITDVADAKNEAISEIGKIAFTNVNKVRGKNVAGKEYYKLAKSSIIQDLLKKEIDIINPKVIVCCGTARTVLPLLDDFTGEVFVMPHPGARKNKTNMLVDLNEQRRNQK